uniref:(California timema) hypothetical protein n=1 Tax=Timema californicum TaxID=61474 RepID=A0A7R9J7I3_TIMCA|nr:unnamed protein product [Timema californicum]
MTIHQFFILAILIEQCVGSNVTKCYVCFGYKHTTCGSSIYEDPDLYMNCREAMKADDQLYPPGGVIKCLKSIKEGLIERKCIGADEFPCEEKDAKYDFCGYCDKDGCNSSSKKVAGLPLYASILFLTLISPPAH